MKEYGLLKNEGVVTTVMANTGFNKAMKENEIKVATTAVGDRYVIEAMREQGYSLGGEQSGHIIFMNYSTTGDGVVTALQILRVMKKKEKSISELAKYTPKEPPKEITIEGQIYSLIELNDQTGGWLIDYESQKDDFERQPELWLAMCYIEKGKNMVTFPMWNGNNCFVSISPHV